MKKIIVTIAFASLLNVTGCSTRENPTLARARLDVQTANQNPILVQQAPTLLEEATTAYNRADQAWEKRRDRNETDHLVYLTNQTLQIAVQEANRKTALSQAQVSRNSAEIAATDLRVDRNMAYARADINGLVADHYREENESNRRLIAALGSELRMLDARETTRGLEFVLSDEVFFESGRSELKPGAVRMLTPLTQFLRENSLRTVAIEGHTDSNGAAAANLNLSQNRAASVRTMFINEGIDPQRLNARGLGEDFPVASNKSAAGRLQNRRVQIVVSPTNNSI